MVYEHRLNQRVKKVFTGLTDVTEPAAREKQAPVDPTKSSVNVGAVVQRSLKTDLKSTG